MKNAGALLIKNGRTLFPDGQFRLCDVLVRDGCIFSLDYTGGHGVPASQQLDAAGQYVLPGFIDLHTHGIGRCRVETASLQEYAAETVARGATTVYPTLASLPEPTAEALKRHRQETKELTLLPQVAGFRLEFPYCALSGGGSLHVICEISQAATDCMLEAGGGHIQIWDVSPELAEAIPTIRRLTQEGIVCSIAHTQASIEQAREAVAAGATLVTHMFDAFAVPDMQDSGVYPVGLIDYLLVEDDVVCEIIPDGTHVYPLLVEKALRCKGIDGVAFVTDSNFGSGLAPGEYVLPEGRGRIRIQGVNAGVRNPDKRDCLTGSALTAVDAFRNAVHLFGLDLAEASRVCSAVPARVMGLNKGDLAEERDADIVILSPELEVIYTIVAGQIMYPHR